MGDREKASLRLQFNPQIRLELPGWSYPAGVTRLELHGATITSDAGLLAFRELDDALDLTPIASSHESCRGLARLRPQRRQNQHHEPF